jgi:drug/metabolite transporter (DMT)-like permease
VAECSTALVTWVPAECTLGLDNLRCVAVLIGVFVAASFGSGDFLGGLASRSARTVPVLALAQLTALVGAVIIALVGGGHAEPRALLLGAGAGLLNVVALGCLYRGLAIGQIGQVAPVAAVVGATVPIVWGLATGERPSPVTLVGVFLAVAAGALVSSERVERREAIVGRALPLALAAGAGFGTSFILFSSTAHNSGFWPALSARGAAVVGVGVVLLLSRQPRRVPEGPRRLAVGAGLLDVTGTALLLVALRHGLTAVVAPVAALAPGFTVMHAWWYLRERASPIQIVGLVAALAGLALIAAG